MNDLIELAMELLYPLTWIESELMREKCYKQEHKYSTKTFPADILTVCLMVEPMFACDSDEWDPAY